MNCFCIYHTQHSVAFIITSRFVENIISDAIQKLSFVLFGLIKVLTVARKINSVSSFKHEAGNKLQVYYDYCHGWVIL